MKHVLLYLILSLATLSTAEAALFVEAPDRSHSLKSYIDADNIAASFVSYYDALENVPGLSAAQFEKADKDKNGYLDKEEFFRLLFD